MLYWGHKGLLWVMASQQRMVDGVGLLLDHCCLSGSVHCILVKK
jgi:hypothetical protein